MKDDQKLHISAFPEVVDTESGIKIYGEASYDNWIATLSHFLHDINTSRSASDDRKFRKKLIELVKEYLDYKEKLQDFTEEDIQCVADKPMAYDIFSDFYNVPFKTPEKYDFTFIDLFAGIGGIRIPFDEMGYKCAFSSEWDAKACKTYFANFGVVPYAILS